MIRMEIEMIRPTAYVQFSTHEPSRKQLDFTPLTATDEGYGWRQEPLIAWPGQFAHGQRVRKKSGSEWQGRVVGFYMTSMTPIGYAVESERHRGSVQIYPESALDAVE